MRLKDIIQFQSDYFMNVECYSNGIIYFTRDNTELHNNNE